MSHSMVTVTDDQANDGLVLFVAQDGTVCPDRQIVENYLSKL